ncbi:MAG: PAS domain S-box protein [Archaeoglobaceae archaeon]
MIYKDSMQPSESLWQKTFDSVTDAVCLLDLDLTILQCNKAMADFVGRPIDEIIGKTCWEVIHGTKKPNEDCPVIKMKKSLKRESLVLPIDNKWFYIIADPLFGENGELTGCIHVIRDVSKSKESEKDLTRILENVPVPTFVLDKEHKVKYWNKACEELTGYKKNDIIGSDNHWKPFFSNPRPLLADVVLDGVEEFYKNKKVKKRKIKKVKDQEDTYEMELFLPRFGRWVYFRASLLKSDGEVLGAIETMEDVSERRLMEEIVKAAEQEKGAVLDSMSEVVMFQNNQHRVMLANRAAGKAVGMEPNAMVGDSCYEVWFNRSEPCENCPIERAYETGMTQEAEITDGKHVWKVSGYPVKDEGGNISGIVEVGLDITERKESEKDLTRILENVPVPTFVLDKEHKVKYWNKACEELTGYKKNDIIGSDNHWKPFFSNPRPLLADVVLDGVEEFYKNKKVKKRKIKKVKDQEDTYEMELFLPRFGRWVYFRASLLKSDGEVLGAIETMEDVSERRLMEEIVKAAEQEKGAVLDSMSEVVMFQNNQHRVMLANRAAGKAVGMEPNAMVGDSCYEVWFNRSEPCENCPIERAYETGMTQEAEITNGDKVWFIRGYPVKDESGKVGGIVEVGQEITERKRAEDKIREREELYRNLVERANDGIAIVQDDLVKYVNPRLTEMGGYSLEELIDTNFAKYIHPDEVSKAVDRYNRRMAGEDVPAIYETILKNREGDKLFVEVNAGITTYQGRPADLVILRDITERKRIEEKLRRQLMKFKLEDGYLYLVKEGKPALSLEALKDLMKVGYSTLIISRNPKEEFKKSIKENFEFLWLGEKDGSKVVSIREEQIEEMLESIPRKSAVLIDRLDYVIFKRGFGETLSFIQRLRDISYFNELVIILSINPETLNIKELNQLEAETNEIEPQFMAKLPEDLLEVLRYVYKQNNRGVKPIYTDICNELGISKPTAMNRVRQLVSKGYVTSNVKGRSKVVELTEKGWSLFLDKG